MVKPTHPFIGCAMTDTLMHIDKYQLLEREKKGNEKKRGRMEKMGQ